MRHHDRDDELRRYVRDRMRDEMPPELPDDIMSGVHQTAQRRRGMAWPIIGGLAAVAAAAIAITVGVGALDDREVGDDPRQASATPSPRESASPTPRESQSATARPSASPSADSGIGEFGPVESMAPEDAFPNAQTCEVVDPHNTTGGVTELSFRISFPAEWHTNSATERRSACTLFASERFDVPDDGTIPETVAIVLDVPPGGDFGVGGSSVNTSEATVDGVEAIRYEIQPEPGGFTTEPTVVWVIGIAGSMPAEGNAQPYLTISTSSDNPEQMAEWTEILDRMVSTLDIAE